MDKSEAISHSNDIASFSIRLGELNSYACTLLFGCRLGFSYMYLVVPYDH